MTTKSISYISDKNLVSLHFMVEKIKEKAQLYDVTICSFIFCAEFHHDLFGENIIVAVVL